MSIPTLKTARSNRLLAALPRVSLERLIPSMHLRALPVRQVPQKGGGVLEGVLF